MHRSKRSSSDLVAGEAVCGGGVDVTRGQAMAHGRRSYSVAETNGLPLALPGKRPDDLARLVSSPFLRSRGAEPRTDITCARDSLLVAMRRWIPGSARLIVVSPSIQRRRNTQFPAVKGCL